MEVKPLGERTRWLSAVLIVVSIGGIGALVRFWPAPTVASNVTATLHSQQIFSFDAPSALVPRSLAVPVLAPAVVFGRTIATPTETVSLASSLIPAEGSVVENADVRQGVGGQDVRVDLVATPQPVLDSRFLDLPRVEPIAVAQNVTHQLPDDASMNPFVEIPAVAVTRVLEVAGRGLRTGARATGALVRLAF